MEKPNNGLLAEQVRTEPLAPQQLASFIPEIRDLCSKWGYDNVTVSYGFGCNLPFDKLWQPKQIPTRFLDRLIQSAVQDGYFQLGACDLHIEDAERTLEFRLCHESDVHFESVDQGRVQEVVTLWRKKGLTLFLSSGPKASALPKQWKRIYPNCE